MTKKDVQVGQTYIMRHTSGRIKVRVLRQVEYNPHWGGPRYHPMHSTTHWIALNLSTGREITLKSAVKLISLA